MFLDFMDTKEGRNISKLARESSTFNAFYKYWRELLFERIMRLFVWENTGDVQPKEIEQRLLLQGHCGITKLESDNQLTAMVIFMVLLNTMMNGLIIQLDAQFILVLEK